MSCSNQQCKALAHTDTHSLRLSRMGASAQLARVEIWDAPLARDDLFATFAGAADAFVLPTRGEGWGLPIVEVRTSAHVFVAWL